MPDLTSVTHVLIHRSHMFVSFRHRSDEPFQTNVTTQIPRNAQRDVDELIALEAFESVSDLGFAGLKGESHRRTKNKTRR